MIAHYAASKFGVIGLVQSLALEPEHYKINVNAICPGYIITNIRDAWPKGQEGVAGISVDEMRAKRHDEKASTVPLGRSGTVEDIVKPILFLLSDQSDCMTGQAVNLTGGLTMH
jgi:meso-butanediol dehydrogenase/(S,S)-butanediol dehydrogenase/diacetyl reductase